MKKTWNFITILAFISLSAFTLAARASENQVIFQDVEIGDQYSVAIQFLKDRKMIGGYADGKYHPEYKINRAEALQILIYGLQDYATDKAMTETMDFTDVKPASWFYKAVQQGLSNHVISNGIHFFPEREINRAEAVKMMLIQKGISVPSEMLSAPYTDVSPDLWFATYAAGAKDLGLVLESRDHGNFNGGDSITRGEFSDMIYRLIKSSEGIKFGRATYYADSLAGRGMSSGDPYNPAVYTTAHKTLPLGTHLTVTNLANGKSVEVTVNDRGPYATGIELDLSKSAFSAIADPRTGIITTQYKIEEN